MLLASCSTEIKFHTWPNGDYYGSYQIPEATFYIPSISWCSEGKLLVSTVPSLGSPIVVSVSDVGIQTHHVIDALQIQAACFSRASQPVIVLGSDAGGVLVYDVREKKMVRTLAPLPYAVRYLEYGASDTSLAAGCSNGQICLYNSSWEVGATFYVPNSESLTAMSCHPNVPFFLAAASLDGVVVVWDSNTGNTQFLDKPHSSSVTGVAFSTEHCFASVGLDSKFIGYDIRTKECSFSNKTNERLSSLAFMPASDNVAVATADGKLFSYDQRMMHHPLHTLVAHHPKAIGKVAFQNIPLEASPDDAFTKSNLTTVVFNSPAQLTRQSSESMSPEFLKEAAVEADCQQRISTVYPEVRDSSHHQPIAAKCVFTSSSIPSDNFFDESCDYEQARQEVISYWLKKLPTNFSKNLANATVVPDQDEDIMKLRKQLQDLTKVAIDQLTDFVNKEFLKIRMAVSRGFVQMECKMNARLRDLNMILTKLAESTYDADDGENEDVVEEVSASRLLSERTTSSRSTRYRKQ